MGFKENVIAMKNAGIPDVEIDAYVQKHGQNYDPNPTITDQIVSGLKERGTWEGVGGLIGGGIGATAGGTAGGFGAIPAGIVGSGLGASAGGQLNDLVFGNEGSLLDQSKKAATDIAVETGMGIIAPKVVQLGADLTKNALGPVTKMATGLRGVGASTVDDLAAMERQGLKPDASYLNNNTTQRVGQNLRNQLGASKTMQEIDAHNYGQTQNLVDDIAAKFGRSESAEQTGKLLKGEAKKKKAQFFDISDKLYKRAYENLPEQFEVPNLKNFVDNELVNLQQNPVSIRQNKEAITVLNDIGETIGGQGIADTKTINSFKKLASDAFKRHPSNRTPADNVLIDMRNVYADDIEEAVLKNGSMEDARRLEVANDFWKKGVGDKRAGAPGYLDRYDKILGAEEGGGAYRYATQLINNKYGGADRLKSIFQSNPGAREEIKGQIFRDLGGGQGADGFSYQKFLTGYSKLSPEVQELVFGRSGQAFDDLKRISEMAASLEKKGNFSNTENLRYWNELFKPITQGTLYGGIAGGNPMVGAAVGSGLVGAGAAKNAALAKLYTKPEFVKWLAETGERVLMDPNGFSSGLTKLALISSRWPNEEAEAVQGYLNDIGLGTRTTKGKDGKIYKMEIEK